jgi:amidohydrolase
MTEQSNSDKVAESAKIATQARDLQGEIVALRRHLHEHPELGFEEFETAKLAADKLESSGFKVQKGVGKTGVVANLAPGRGPLVAIRADMDGLPIEEKNETAYRSKNPSVMHACGHDAHVSCAMATAKILAGQGSNLKGGIRMLLQPAEEMGDADGKSGAARMIEDDAMNGVDAVIGLHMDGGLPAGKIGLAAGPVMAASDAFCIHIYGKGGHGAFPETTIDAVVIASTIVSTIQQIVSRKIAGAEPAIVTIGSFHSSSQRGNVISEEVVLQGTFRTFDLKTRAKIKEELDRACSIARVLGGDYKIEYEEGYPCLVNDPTIVDVMREVAVEMIGEENVITLKPKGWSEDFSMFANMAPGAFMFLGGELKRPGQHEGYFPHHTATFDIDESGLWIGSAILSQTALRLHKVLRK